MTLTASERRRLPWFCAAVFAAAILAYWPALPGGRLWDDDALITRTELVSLHGLHRIWTDLGATEQYYPLLFSAFWVEHRLWGDSTLGYHLLNVLLHAASACLLALVLLEVRRDEAGRFRLAPWFAAFLFALHPVCVESVAWITEQKNTLSTVFYLLAALFYFRWRLGGPAAASEGGGPPLSRRGGYWLATAFFILSLMTKTVTATLPAALLVVLWWREGKLTWRGDIGPLLPWCALGIGGGLFTGWVERVYIGAHGAAYNLTLAQRTVVAGRAAWFYLGKLLWPGNLIFHYPHWTIDPDRPAEWIPAAAMAALLAVLAWAATRREWARAGLAGLLFYLGTLFPTLGFLNVYAFIFSYVADHWQYLASFGVIALAAEAWARWTRSSLAVAAAVLGVLGVLTWRQSRLYRDAPTLYRATLERNPDAWLIHFELGNILMARGQTEEAARHFRRTIAIEPDYPQAHDNLGILCLNAGKVPEAIGEFETTLRLRPDATDAHINLARALTLAGRLPEAIEQFHDALRLDPGAAELRNNLGNVLSQAGRLPEAIGEYQAAVRLKPNFADARVNLANALSQSGRMPEAFEQYRAAIALDPASVEGRFNWAVALLEAGRPGEAAEQFQAADRLSPRNPMILEEWGIALAAGNRLTEAEARLSQAASLAPNSAEVEVNLGQVLLQEGRPIEAIERFERALQIDPRLEAARQRLALARRSAGG